MVIDRKGKTGRRPGKTNSRDVILEAARARFAAHGFDGATLRAIAADAGADPALIRHYFGDKEGLFAATLALPAGLTHAVVAAFEAGRPSLGERVARQYLAVWEDPTSGPSMIALTRTAFGHEQAMNRFRDFLLKTAGEELVPHISDDRPMLRLNLAMGQLLSVALSRHIIQLPAAVDATVEEIVAAIGPVIDRLLFDELTN